MNIIIFFYICVFSGWFMIAQRIDGCLVKIWKEGFAKPTSTPHKIYFHFVNIHHCANITLCAHIISAMEHLANADEWWPEDFQWNGRV